MRTPQRVRYSCQALGDLGGPLRLREPVAAAGRGTVGVRVGRFARCWRRKSSRLGRGSRRGGRGTVRSPWASARRKTTRRLLRVLRLVYALMVRPCAASVGSGSPALSPTWLPPGRRRPRGTAPGWVAEGRGQVAQRGLHVLAPAGGRAARVSSVVSRSAKVMGVMSPVQVEERSFRARTGEYSTVLEFILQ